MRGIFWEITMRCNLRCNHCYLYDESVGLLQCARELSTEDCLYLVDQLERANVFTVTVLGGEPFVRTDIMTILKYMGKKKFWTTVDTNGTLIDEKTAAELADTKIKAVNVSLEGPTPAVNDVIRGKKSFEKAVRGINHLRDFDIPFRISMTVCKQNYTEIESMADFSHQMGASSVAFSMYVVSPQLPCSQFLALGREEVIAAARMVTSMKPKFSPGFVSANFENAESFLCDQRDEKDTRFVRCGLGASQLVILCNGDVIPCTYMRDQVVGNVMETPLAHVPETPEFAIFKNLRTLTVDEANEKCASCTLRYSCGGGCRGQAYLIYHDLLAPDPRRCLVAWGCSPEEIFQEE